MKLYTLEELFSEEAALPIQFVHYLMQAQVSCIFTGKAGGGRTTTLVAALAEAPASLTLRASATIKRDFLEELFPMRMTVPADEPCENAVLVVGDVFSDAEIMYFMDKADKQFAMCAYHALSPEELFSNFAKTIRCSTGRSEEEAVAWISDTLRVNIHVSYSADGRRFIERITELMPSGTGVDIITYDHDTNTYQRGERPSDELFDYMLKHTPAEDHAELIEFVEQLGK